MEPSLKGQTAIVTERKPAGIGFAIARGLLAGGCAGCDYLDDRPNLRARSGIGRERQECYRHRCGFNEESAARRIVDMVMEGGGGSTCS